MDNQLGPMVLLPCHYIVGPDDNPTGFSLLTISHDNGIYEYQGGEPTQGFTRINIDTAILMRNDHFLYQEHVGYIHLMNQLIMSICIPEAIEMQWGS